MSLVEGKFVSKELLPLRFTERAHECCMSSTNQSGDRGDNEERADVKISLKIEDLMMFINLYLYFYGGISIHIFLNNF